MTPAVIAFGAAACVPAAADRDRRLRISHYSGMETPKVTLARLGGHEYWRSLRRIIKVIPPRDYLESLVAQRYKMLREFLAASTLAFVVLLSILNANGNSIDFRLAFIDLSIPLPYALFAASLLTFASDIALLNYFFQHYFLGLAVKKILSFDSSSVVLSHVHGNEEWSSGLNLQYRFFKSGLAHRSMIGFAFIVTSIPFVAILGLLHWQLAKLALAHIFSTPNFPFERTSSFISLIMVMFPIVYTGLLFLPFRLQKNTSFIKWGFLSKMS